jgi:hypothetical protein
MPELAEPSALQPSLLPALMLRLPLHLRTPAGLADDADNASVQPRQQQQQQQQLQRNDAAPPQQLPLLSDQYLAVGTRTLTWVMLTVFARGERPQRLPMAEGQGYARCNV